VFGALALLGLVLSAIYILRVFRQSFWGQLPEGVSPNAAGDLSWRTSIPHYLLFSFLLVLGVFPYIFINFVNQTSLNLLKGF